MSSFARRALRRGLLVAAGLVVGVLAAEGVARVVSPQAGANLLYGAPDAVPAELYVYDPHLGNVLAPGARVRIATVDYDVDVRVNALGLRGPEPTGAPAWVVLGDSFVLALQVDEAESLPARLAERLGTEVLNAGVDGFGTWQEALLFERIAAAAPVAGVVLVVFLGNDFTDNRGYLATRGGPGGTAPKPPELKDRRARDAATTFLYRNSALYAYVNVARRRAAMEAADERSLFHFRKELEAFTAEGEARELRPGIQDTLGAIRRLRQAAAARGAGLTVAIAPPYFALDPAEADALFDLFGVPGAPAVDRPAALLTAALAAEGIPACDLTPALAASLAAGDRPYFRYDGHWNAVGHAVAADAIADCVRRPASPGATSDSPVRGSGAGPANAR